MGAVVDVIFHPLVWPRVDMDVCHGFDRGRVFAILNPNRTKILLPQTMNNHPLIAK
jgi:hypothetical protein